jgi:hypothetical protein
LFDLRVNIVCSPDGSATAHHAFILTQSVSPRIWDLLIKAHILSYECTAVGLSHTYWADELSGPCINICEVHGSGEVTSSQRKFAKLRLQLHSVACDNTVTVKRILAKFNIDIILPYMPNLVVIEQT